MKDYNFFRLLLSHLEERKYNNVFQNLLQDADYLKVTQYCFSLLAQLADLK